jgi:hypothetical protein
MLILLQASRRSRVTIPYGIELSVAEHTWHKEKLMKEKNKQWANSFYIFHAELCCDGQNMKNVQDKHKYIQNMDRKVRYNNMRFEVLKVVKTSMFVFRVVTSCGLVGGCQSFIRILYAPKSLYLSTSTCSVTTWDRHQQTIRMWAEIKYLGTGTTH